MRDVERLREKHQISLDGRQVAAVALCALLLLGGVFGLGVTLGKRLERAGAAPAPGRLAELDDAARKGPPPLVASIPAKATATPASATPAPHEDASRKLAADASHPGGSSGTRAPLVVPPPPRPVQVASLVAPSLTPPPKDLGDYTVQLGASQDRTDAQRLESRARAAGLRPYVMEADLGRKGLWYRVRVGSFPDKEAASRFRKDVERELRSPAVVMATR